MTFIPSNFSCKPLWIACLFFLQFANAQVKQAPVSPEKIAVVEGVTEYKLPNGLQVLLVPDASQTNVVVNVVYHVGSRNEGYGETGMAHLLEHMLFKGSKKFSSIKQTIADKGAMANGTTDYDRTNYFEVLPAVDSNLHWALEMESDRMVNSLMKKEDLKKEFTVVRNEFEMDENYPDNILEERVLSTMYLWHNYGKSVIGSKEDIERVPIENLKVFYQKFYQPDNATLIVGGKFDEKKTLQWITALFGIIPKPKRVIQPDYTIEPAQDGERMVELRRNGDLQYIGMGYHTPAYSDKDYAANAVLIQILINDPAGILYKALVETKLATKVGGYSKSLYDPGFTYFSCDVPLDKNLDSAKAAFISTMNSFPGTNFTQDQLDRAKNTLLKRISNVFNNTISYSISLADVISGGDWRLLNIYRDRIEKLNLADLQEAASKYYLPSNRTVGIFVPDKSPKRTQVAERPDIHSLVSAYKGNTTTTQTATFEATISNIKKSTVYGKLSNGMKYALLQKPAKGDKVYANIVLKFGDEKALTNQGMLPELTARMLRNGTTTRSKKDINDQLDKLKSSISVWGNAGSVSISLNSDKTNISNTLDILEDILLHPSFDQNEFDKMILDMKGEYESGKSDPQTVASIAFSKKTSLYPKGHPYYSNGTDESIEELGKAKLDAIKAFYLQFYGTNNGTATFVGGIEPTGIQSFLEKKLSNFNSKAVYQEIEEKYFEIKGSTQSIITPDKKNAMCIGGINIPIKETDPDYPSLEMANELLGGGAFLSSRIPQRLRESEGMSYGAGSYLNINYKYPASSWGVYALFNPQYKNRLDSALLDEINKALKGGFKEDELKKSTASWLQQRKTLLGLDNYLASTINSFLSDGKDLQFSTDLENKVKNLTLDQVNATLRKYVDPAKLVLIYAGDFK